MIKVSLAGLTIAALTATAACRNVKDRNLLQDGKAYQNETQSKQKLRLPDSSTVILAPGAKIELGDGFTSSKKELSLDGEAWFDIKGPVSLHTRDMVVEILRAGKGMQR